MELITLLVILFLVFIVVSVRPTIEMEVIFCIVLLYFGLTIFLEGLSLNGMVITTVGTMPNYVVFVTVVFGSLLTGFQVASERRKKHKALG